MSGDPLGPERIVVIRRHEDDEAVMAYGAYAGYSIYTTEQIVTLEISNSSQCCESWGYFLTEDDTAKFIGAEFWGCRVTGVNRSQIAFMKGGNRTSSPASGKAVKGIDLDGGDVMFVDILTDRGILQFVAYNCQNGYYGHRATVQSRDLKEERYL